MAIEGGSLGTCKGRVYFPCDPYPLTLSVSWPPWAMNRVASLCHTLLSYFLVDCSCQIFWSQQCKTNTLFLLPGNSFHMGFPSHKNPALPSPGGPPCIPHGLQLQQNSTILQLKTGAESSPSSAHSIPLCPTSFRLTGQSAEHEEAKPWLKIWG